MLFFLPFSLPSPLSLLKLPIDTYLSLRENCDQGEGVKDYRVLDRLALSHGLNIKGHIPYTFKFLMKKNISLKSIQEVIEISRLELH